MVSVLKCICITGCTGIICDVEIMECASSPCENNGTCNDLIGYCNFDCMPGYTGETCDIDINDCDPNPCNKNWSSTDLVNDSMSESITGYTDCTGVVSSRYMDHINRGSS